MSNGSLTPREAAGRPGKVVSDSHLLPRLIYKWLCTFSIVAPFIYNILPNVWKALYTICMSIFVDVSYWPPYSTDKFVSCVVPGPSQWFSHFNKEIVITWTQEKSHLVVQNPIILHDNARTYTAVVTDLLCRWQWEILEHPQKSPDMNPCKGPGTTRVTISWNIKMRTLN